MAFQFPVASGKKKTVQVFECPTESWKERTPSSAKRKTKDTEQLSVREEIRKEFDDTFDSVIEFATSNLKGKEKKAADAKKIEALGGKGAKNRSMPYKMLIGLRTKGADKKKRREDLVREVCLVADRVAMGIDVAIVLQFQDEGGGRGDWQTEGKWKVEGPAEAKKVDYGLQATKGRFKGGVLDVRGL